MELTDKEKKELKRCAQFDKKWRTMYWMGWVVAFFFSLVFIVMGIYIYIQLLPRLGSLQPGFNEDLKMAYSLWCYTFVLLGFSSFISGYLMINYCSDVHFLYTLYGRSASPVAPEEKPPLKAEKPPIRDVEPAEKPETPPPPEKAEPREEAEHPEAEDGKKA